MKKHTIEQVSIFFSVTKWLLLSSIIGIIIGASVTLFLKILQYAEDSRGLLPLQYYYTLPFALLFTVYIIKKFAPDAGGHGTFTDLDNKPNFI